MKKWRAPRFDDQLHFESGTYVWAERPDAFGPRAFMALNLVWDDRESTYLTDAATQWGMAPWALFEARATMEAKPLGTWEQVAGAHAKAFALLAQACREMGEGFDEAGGLLLLRSALRMERLASDRPLDPSLARHCLKAEAALDGKIRQAKQRAYATEHPDWEPPAP